ncbi:MAG: radical SAM protein [Clostridia bacterium]|nr:radical SAM protein [Clostridia bacterium]
MDIFDMTNCRLCPRECGVDRTKEKRGFCGADDKIICARASLHHWEEPCLSGEKGSGTVFFSGCNMGCVFCQNKEISHGGKGFLVSGERLCEIFFELKEKGAHNINLVTAGHFLPQVLEAVKMAKVQGIGIPFVYNSSGYEKVEALKRCQGLIDIYLPDFKYMNSVLARNYSKAPDYPQVAKQAISEMVRQKPACKFSDNGIMTEGVIVRHLMLPKELLESKSIIKYLYETYSDNIYISIMSQYTPVGISPKFHKLQSTVAESDYDELVDFAIDLGVENAFVQEGEAASESFIPDFSGQGIEV